MSNQGPIATYDLAPLDALSRTEPPGPRADTVRAFTDWFEALARTRPGEAHAWFAAHADALEYLVGHFGHLMYWTERLFESPWYDGEPWLRACRLRSFLEHVFGFAEDGEWWAEELDTEDYDAALRLRGDGDGGIPPEQVPAGMPTSHWWWWLPSDPPQ